MLSGLRIATAFMQGGARGLQYSSLSVEYVLTRTSRDSNTRGFHTQHQLTRLVIAQATGVCHALFAVIVLVRGPYINIVVRVRILVFF